MTASAEEELQRGLRQSGALLDQQRASTSDLFAVMVDVVPYAHAAEEGGFLGAFKTEDMSTPYPDRKDLELGRCAWVALNPGRIRPMLDRFDANRFLLSFEKFVQYVGSQPGAPRIADAGHSIRRDQFDPYMQVVRGFLSEAYRAS